MAGIAELPANQRQPAVFQLPTLSRTVLEKYSVPHRACKLGMQCSNELAVFEMLRMY